MPKPRTRPDRPLTAAEKQAAYRKRQAAARQAAIVSGAPNAPAIATMPGTARWNALIEQARTALTTAAEEMQTYYDERSETWQEGERADALIERIDLLQEIAEQLESA